MFCFVAISSTNFCVARVKAFNVLLSNVLRVIAINTVGDFVLFLGKVLVMAGNVVIAFFLFDVCGVILSSYMYCLSCTMYYLNH